jgi:ELWxxDGT repeat protein
MEQRVFLSASLVRDIGKDSSDIIVSGIANKRVFFTETNHDDLWCSDGTEQGTVKLSAQTPGLFGYESTVFADRLVCPVRGTRDHLLITDGTVDGTTTLWEADAEHLLGYYTAAVGGNIFFTVNHASSASASQCEIWKSDGVQAHTAKLANLPGDSGSQLFALGNRLLCVPGSAICSLNLTSGKPTSLARFSKPVSSPQVLNGRLYFFQSNSRSESELWSTDGTRPGTRRIANLSAANLGSNPLLIGFHGSVYLRGGIPSAYVSQGYPAIWKVNDEAANTTGALKLRVDLKKLGLSAIDQMAPLKKSLVFSAKDSRGHVGIFRTDLTASGTNKISNTIPSGGYQLTQPFVSTANAVFFVSYTLEQGLELWKTDGTSEGTKLVRDLYPGRGSSSPSMLTALGNKILFMAGDPDHGNELWVSDGSAEGTKLVKDLTKGGTQSSSLGHLQTFGRWTYFIAEDSTNGSELWATDGTRKGTHLLADINPGPDTLLTPGVATRTDVPGWLTEIGGRLVFVAGRDHDLWTTDGTPQGTRLLKKLGLSTNFVAFTKLGRKLYFVGGADGTLYQTDGTTMGTSIVKLTNVQQVFQPVTLGAALVFAGYSQVVGWELWKLSDGAKEAELIFDINRGPSDSVTFLQKTSIAGKVVYFTVRNGSVGATLWKTDGTADGTRQVRASANLSSGYSPLGAAGNIHFFSTFQNDLWRTDGTPGGTFRIDGVLPSGYSINSLLGVVHDRMYIAVWNNAHEVEWWSSDGSLNGTGRVTVMDLLANHQGSGIQFLRLDGNRIFFGVGSSVDAATELYISDGTQPGTIPFSPMLPEGAVVDTTVTPIGADESQYFVATDPEHGSELWRIAPVAS